MSCDWSSVSFSALTAASVTCSTGGGASVWSPTLPEECAEVPPDTPGRRPGCVADLHAVSPGFGAGHATWPRLDKEPASLCSSVTPRPPAHSPATRWVRPCARGGGTTGPWPAACAQGGGQRAAGTALAGGRGLSGQARAPRAPPPDGAEAAGEDSGPSGPHSQHRLRVLFSPELALENRVTSRRASVSRQADKMK